MSIITALPGITPTARPYSMGEWPQERMKMRNGRVARWSLSSRPTGDTMELSWENITFAQAELLVSAWDANYGIYGQVTLPPEALAGTSSELSNLLIAPFPGATWHFTENPQVVSVGAFRCTVKMKIKVRGFARYDI